MDINVGVDIVEINKFKNICYKYKERFFRKIFSDIEMEYLKKDSAKMCISFSFKESIWKALPEEIQRKIFLKDIKIGWKDNKPFLIEEINNYKFLLTFSLIGRYVVTIVLLLNYEFDII
ncbi:MAG: 4'-phosphopantetheinyl transferase superfamily protein [Candidatus Omnitrophica bacterium]|nr:4'-phosphopantetheinyl transferase superfamily protein [Candidatus Omnitrophota bacterium]